MPTPMTAGAMRTLLENLPENTPLYDDATGRPILDAYVDTDGAPTLVLMLDNPEVDQVANSYTGGGTFSGVLIQTGGNVHGNIRL
ncbi:hypothetical protein Q8791_30525 [Nocardiopsis sp. CT-R113]|uniref:Uncharacterized protein n=1 Tax=Nocardiopsis codii TaxID=3065942 RepID=A0ABU7KH52_9ACTN|nr:hypothetical protein [Nocardiopsis sp. CT-R113]MEE2041566.1 hypothetical protein [Nocardiopsis sp. CT-R113]